MWLVFLNFFISASYVYSKRTDINHNPFLRENNLKMIIYLQILNNNYIASLTIKSTATWITDQLVIMHWVCTIYMAFLW